jgi:hypothetical protein
MMQKLSLFMGHPFVKPHHKLEFIFRDDDGLGGVRHGLHEGVLEREVEGKGLNRIGGGW